VAQDAGDEPASELLKQIRAEKDRLMAAGKIKRDKPLAVIAEGEMPFELPVGWEWVRWTDIAMKIGGIDHKMPSEAKDGVPYVSPRDFYGANEIDFDGAKKIARSDYLDLKICGLPKTIWGTRTWRRVMHTTVLTPASVLRGWFCPKPDPRRCRSWVCGNDAHCNCNGRSTQRGDGAAPDF
jgi:hypothetical protein